ncbi:MAG: hypothetical protein GY787_13400 [Alteromonadales bacterium]|nr:hypothetical protein [Alteromonadales bacterium]
MSYTLKKLNKVTNKQASSNTLSRLNKFSDQKSDVITSELMQIAKQSGLEALREIKTPLNPILSWFDEAPAITLSSKIATNVWQDKTTTDNNHQTRSLARLPLKSPPCKKCPALNKGLCKCALKRFK